MMYSSGSKKKGGIVVDLNATLSTELRFLRRLEKSEAQRFHEEDSECVLDSTEHDLVSRYFLVFWKDCICAKEIQSKRGADLIIGDRSTRLESSFFVPKCAV